MALSKTEKIGLGVAAVAGAAALAVTFWPKPSEAQTPSTTGSTPFRTQLPKGTAPLAGAGEVDAIGDSSIAALLPILPGAKDFSQPGATLKDLASAAVGPKAKTGGPVIAVLSVGYNPSPSGSEAAYVRQVEQIFRSGYDRLIWLVTSEMPQAERDAITGNATEYVEVMSHAATPDGLKKILYG